MPSTVDHARPPRTEARPVSDCLAWQIDPLPDFLVDHTLAGAATAERLREVVSRWVQWVGSLWSWRDRATFALRFLAADGRITVYLLARAHLPGERDLLAGEVGVLLRSHRLAAAAPRDAAQTDMRPGGCDFDEISLVEVYQHESRALWALPENIRLAEPFRSQLAWLTADELRQPRVIYPWWAPGGPFLVPMESLLSQPVPTTLTVYLQPTQLLAHEWQWLAVMAREAQTRGEQNLQQLGSGAAMRVCDPSAGLAGRLYMANLRRLSAGAFLVSVHCAAAGSRDDAARSVAGAVQGLVHETPFDRPHEDDDRLPSAASLRAVPADPGGADRQQALRLYVHLRFPQPDRNHPLQRLPHLVDARGSATVFRLPVSVRGGVPGLRVRQLSPDFHPGPREALRPDGHLDLGRYESGGRVFIPVRDLTKHALITGFTGSGKTVTVLQILHQLWADHDVPFLVLESAKQEYRGLLGVDAFRSDLRVYTVGNELCAPLRLNPFELLPGVRVEAHLSKLQTCFEAAIPPIGPSVSVIAEALLRVYEASGWSLTDVCPTQGRPARQFPVLSQFVAAVERVLEERGYEGEVQSNLRAALVGRFKPLLIGGKGRMFDTQRSWPAPADLLSRPAVLELNDLNLDDKALVVMFVLTLLREYRERHRTRAGELVHVTMVEEAHNVLENVASKGGGEGATSADTRFKAVEAFCQLLTEIRALGEGLIIADQSPEKLARDAMRNTNLQIAHQLRDGHDREAIANAMIMEREQRDFLGKLAPGQAALFRTGLEKATFVRVEQYYPTAADQPPQTRGNGQALERQFRGAGFAPHLSDDELEACMLALEPSLAERRRLSLPFGGCDFCRAQCRCRDAVFCEAARPESQKSAEEWFRQYRDEAQVTGDELWSLTIREARGGALRAGSAADSVDAAWCYFLHMWHGQLGQTADAGLDPDRDCYERFVKRFQTEPSGREPDPPSIPPPVPDPSRRARAGRTRRQEQPAVSGIQ